MSRTATYSLIIGSAVAILLVGLGIPLVVGSAEPVATPSPASAAATGSVHDHDTRQALYDDLALVRGVVPPPDVPRTASDRGVTPTTVTLGIVLIGLGSVSALGIDTSSLDPRVQRTYWDAAISRVNQAGGIEGRRLVGEYATADVLSTDSMRAACRVLTEDRPVFAVLNVLGFTGDPILCVTRDHQTPYIGIDGADSEYYSASQGRLVTIEPTTDRTLTELFRRLRATLAGHRVGVVHPTTVPTAILRQELGTALVADGPLGAGDPLIVSGQVAAAQRRMQQARVDTVLLLTNAVYGTVFAMQADQSRFVPRYLLSDLGYATAGDSFLANMPKSFFHDVVAVTSTEIGRGHANLPESRLDQGCRDDFTATTGTKAPRDSGEAAAAIASCALVQLVTMGLNGAGANPTRSTFTAALAHAGLFALPGFGHGLLEGRLDAADDVAVAGARADCECFTALDGYRAA